jgi:hypothetical protein
MPIDRLHSTLATNPEGVMEDFLDGGTGGLPHQGDRFFFWYLEANQG